MSRAERHTLAAMDVAQWLDDQGDHFRANAVRSVCRSLSTARATMSALRRDNAELRKL
jgi:transposase InsO family protein